MRANASHLRHDKRVHEMELEIETSEELAIDLVMHGQCHFGAVLPDLSEVDQAHDVDVSAR